MKDQLNRLIIEYNTSHDDLIMDEILKLIITLSSQVAYTTPSLMDKSIFISNMSLIIYNLLITNKIDTNKNCYNYITQLLKWRAIDVGISSNYNEIPLPPHIESPTITVEYGSDNINDLLDIYHNHLDVSIERELKLEICRIVREAMPKSKQYRHTYYGPIVRQVWTEIDQVLNYDQLLTKIKQYYDWRTTCSTTTGYQYE